MSKALLLMAWLIPTALWLLAMTRWRRGILQRRPAGSPEWYWLAHFRDSRNRTESCEAACGCVGGGDHDGHLWDPACPHPGLGMSARSNERRERPAGKAERRKDGELAGGRSAASR